MTHLRAPRRLATPLLLLACATLVLRLVVGGQAVLLVRPELLPFLVVAAAVLVGLAVVALVGPPAAHPGHSRNHAGAPLRDGLSSLSSWPPVSCDQEPSTP